ncbi:hypothetical protein H4219_000659 [Mycoemilia scoparia]|uniref:Uncharacterized protein n=1 Tax=Mycoemilia scoparia TaxID=417184 RepID=A0A9W8A6D1_9FUNG|nr:hypothetical protein H4219_000659 [Mycoemilia scoparia]
MESLNFDPVSIAVSDDYLVVGGQHSELAVTSLKDPRNTKITYIGGSINNYVVFDAQKKGCRQRDSGYMEDSVSHEDGMHMSSQHPHLLLCNNDHTIRIVSVPEINVLFEVQLPTAVNYASVSPDQTKVVAVGDSNEVFLFNKRGSDLELVTTLTGSSDAAFSCDWNQVSDIFAVGSQDGIVNVWDTRSTHKLAILETYQRGRTKGACRNVKFSPSGSVDLLAYSEVSISGKSTLFTICNQMPSAMYNECVCLGKQQPAD